MRNCLTDNIQFPLFSQLALPLHLCQTLTSLMQPHLEPIHTLLLGSQQRLQVSVVFIFSFFSPMCPSTTCCRQSCTYTSTLFPQDPQWFRRSTMEFPGACTLPIFFSNRRHRLLVTQPISKHPIRDQGQASHR